MFGVMSTKEAQRDVATRTYLELLSKRRIDIIQEAIFQNEHFPLAKLMSENRAVTEEARFPKVLHIMSLMAVPNAVLADAIPFVRKAIQTNVLVLQNTLLSCLQEGTCMLLLN